MTQPTPQHKQIKAAAFQQEGKQVHQSPGMQGCTKMRQVWAQHIGRHELASPAQGTLLLTDTNNLVC
jgi:hypothetical protein